jgi:hypothetical protein
MATSSVDILRPMVGLSKSQWLTQMAELTDEHGYFIDLGPKHYASFVEDRPTLLVTFETLDSIQNMSDLGQPLGFEMVEAQGWSHLCLISDGDTWFRAPQVYGFIDRLTDDGFFEDFEKVIFYGAGSCGYAASAFSVAAPGATVLTVRPQATLDPSRAGWDPRYKAMRKVPFDDRYGYAPDMIEAADQAFVLYDPQVQLDAMHAALFNGDNTTHLSMPHMGETPEHDLVDMRLLLRLLETAGNGNLTPQTFATMYRERRDYTPYLQRLLARLDADDRPYLSTLLCENVSQRIKARRFSERLSRLRSQPVPEVQTPAMPQIDDIHLQLRTAAE